MNHKQRVEAAQLVASRLLERYPDEIIAIGLLGSVARKEDREHSDIDMHVLVRQGSVLSSHFFVLNGSYFSVQVKTEDEWIAELTKPMSGLCLTAGAFSNVLVLHDPSGVFKRLRTTSETLPDEAWKAAIREGLAGIVEDLGRVRNMYNERNRDDFRLFSVLVAIGAAKVYGDLTRQMLVSEKKLNTVFERRGGPRSEAARKYRVAARLVEATDKETMEALEWLDSFLTEETRREDALPQMRSSAKDYEPP